MRGHWGRVGPERPHDPAIHGPAFEKGVAGSRLVTAPMPDTGLSWNSRARWRLSASYGTSHDASPVPVAAWKADNRTVDVHFYANEGHSFVKRENQIDAPTRLVDWFDKYLKDGHGG